MNGLIVIGIIVIIYGIYQLAGRKDKQDEEARQSNLAAIVAAEQKICQEEKEELHDEIELLEEQIRELS